MIFQHINTDCQLSTWLTHWGQVTHMCIGNLTIIGPDNGLSPGRRQAIIWTNAGILLIEPFRTNFSEISIEIHTFSFKEMHLKMSSGKWRPFCLGLNVLIRATFLVFNSIFLSLNIHYIFIDHFYFDWWIIFTPPRWITLRTTFRKPSRTVTISSWMRKYFSSTPTPANRCHLVPWVCIRWEMIVGLTHSQYFLFIFILFAIYLCFYLASPVYKQKQTRTEPTNLNNIVNVCTFQCVWMF